MDVEWISPTSFAQAERNICVNSSFVSKGLTRGECENDELRVSQ